MHTFNLRLMILNNLHQIAYKNRTFIFLLLFTLPGSFLWSQEKPDSTRQKPFVRGGVYDKPFVTNLFGRTAIGGYTEMLWKLEREEGITEAATFEARRFNIFLFSTISDRLRFFTELEFEHGTEEIALEFAALDFEIHPSLVFRGGVILSPLGKFNLTHDSPLNELTDRPLVSTQIIPTALSEIGMGVYGAFYPSLNSRLSYEMYAVNGLHEGILDNTEGTRISEGKGNLEEDNNSFPSIVSRIAYSPFSEFEIGASVHTGPFNQYNVEDVAIDEKRIVTIAALDWEFTTRDVDFLGEYAYASIDIPAPLLGLFAERQQGIYAQLNFRFGRQWISLLPSSYVTASLRYDNVDFDADMKGDATQRLSLGFNFRPSSDAVFKLDYHYDWMRDRLNILTRGMGLNFGLASYF
ncbi:MAG: hypothetical protein EPO24_02480 [Bacteroidetes bacterium]|nr:MAG: hypothetical protein EPO24_02480 [Bacteroidota bacterium]